MLGSIALVVAALLGQTPPEASGTDVGPPATPTPDVPVNEKDLLHPGDLAFDLSFGLPTRSATGEIEAELNVAAVAMPWHLGPALAGFRFGLISGSARDTCTAEPVEICGFAGMFAGSSLASTPASTSCR